jgi:hypothetical protein
LDDTRFRQEPFAGVKELYEVILGMVVVGREASNTEAGVAFLRVVNFLLG